MEIKEFEENDCINYMRKAVGDKIAGKYSDDDILLLVDAMYDFYESEEDETDDDNAVSDETWVKRIVSYVQNCLRRDPDNTIEMDDVKPLVEAEIEYEDTLFEM